MFKVLVWGYINSSKKESKTFIPFQTIMDETLTLSLSGTSSVLESQFFPPIELSKNKNYVLGLVELLTFNTIPNIDKDNNKFYILEEEDDPIVLPVGSYEIEDIEKYLQKHLASKNITLNLKANNNTLHSSIECSHKVDFRPRDSLGRLLGFVPRILNSNTLYESDHPVNILKINSLRVECNITAGAYLNGEKVHTIHEFFPAVPPGFKIIEIPAQVIYLPITVKTINTIQIRIVDQDGHSVNFRGEVITLRLHLKSI